MKLSRIGFKKAIAFILSAAIVAGVFMFLASGEEYTDATGYTYTLSGSGSTITGYDGQLEGAVMLPDTLGGETVVAIGNGAFKDFSDVLCFFMPGTVTSIGDYAFEGCSALIDAYLPDSLVTVGDGAFWGCSSLVSVTFPQSVESIGAQVLFGAISLESLVILGKTTRVESLFDVDVDLGNFVSIGSSVEIVLDVDATIYLYKYLDESAGTFTEAFDFVSRNPIYNYVFLENAELTSSTVYYIGEGGTSLFPSKTYAVQPVGISVAAVAPVIYPYEPDSVIKSAVLATDSNYITFNFSDDYTITFDSNGGSAVESVIFSADDSITSLPEPELENYTFAGWTLEGAAFTLPTQMPASHITLVATWELNKYNVRFNDWDGSLIQEGLVEHGSAATAPTSPQRTGYTFKNWDVAFDNITSELTVTALYTINYYRVIFANWNGSVISGQDVAYGGNATPPTDPKRTGYTFTGWSGDYTNITEPVTVTAQFEIMSYEVVFKDWDDSVIDTQSVQYGSAATAPANPERTGYTFKNWDKAFSTITSDLTVTAVYTINSFTVIFEDWDGTELSRQTVEFGSAATAPADPERTGYTFTGWSDSYDSITSETTVTAQYDIIYYTVEFVDWNGDVIDTQQVAHGSAATAPSNPEREGYTFSKWLGSYAVITSNMTISAEYNINYYTVSFVDWDDSEIDTQSIAYGSAATAPADPERTGYTFAGWDSDFSEITQALTVKAQYTINSFTVIFADWNGETIKEERVNYGSAATAPSNPSRVGYSFIGWNKAYNDIRSNVTVTAIYLIKSYTVVFKNHNGDTLSSQSVNYGLAAIAPISPERVGYLFTGWDKDFTNITDNLVVTAQFEIQYFTVTFVDWDSTQIGEAQSVAYGSAATAPADPERDGYTFLGWDVAFDVITDDLTVTATYELIPEAIELLAVDDSTAAIDSESFVITGLSEKLGADGMASYVTVGGDGEVEYVGMVTYIGTGTRLILKNAVTGEQVAEYTVVIYGDINGDGVISVADQTLIKKAAAGSIILEGAELKAADLNGDGEVSSADYTVIKTVLKGSAQLNQETGLI